MNKTLIKWIYSDELESNCFFRSALNPPYLKVMLQVTNRCNMHCKHCFLSATNLGNDLSYDNFMNSIIDKLVLSNVKKITLTGGEPLLNPSIFDMIYELDQRGIEIAICSNASLIDYETIKRIGQFNVHFNISLDGVLDNSYGLFRETYENNSVKTIIQNIISVGEAGLLKGILTTPNAFIQKEEYFRICDLAIDAKADYLLFNPLSPLGRGKYASDLALNTDEMIHLRKCIDDYISNKKTSLKIVYIRFPNAVQKTPASCQAGLIPYIFTNGDIAICPYLVFAAENIDNHLTRQDFIIGNIFDDINLSSLINNYKKSHAFCSPEYLENLGCPAMKIANNIELSSCDVL